MTEVRRQRRLRLVDELPDLTRPVIGRIVDVSEEGCIRIDFAGNQQGPVSARTTVQLSRAAWQRLAGPVSVLLWFEAADPSRPVVTGLISDRLFGAAQREEAPDRPEITVDGDRVCFEARQEIELRCGEGSIRLTADGRIVIKGKQLVSRAEQVNKIRGATVQIN